MSGDLRNQLERYGQDHLLEGWDRLDVAARAGLTAQLTEIDWDQLDRLLSGGTQENSFALAEQATSPELVRSLWQEGWGHGWISPTPKGCFH